MKENIMKELQLFTIWNNARNFEPQLLHEIAENFEIIQTFDIKWTDQHFAENLSRFYGKKLPKVNKKKKEVGAGRFLLVMVFDHNPQYADEKNQNMLSCKAKLRALMGQNMLHASDNEAETEENMLFFLGLTKEEFLSKYAAKWNGKSIMVEADILGTPEWFSEKDLFDFVQKIPGCIMNEENGAYVLHTSNLTQTKRFLNAAKKFSLIKKNIYKVPLNGKHKLIRLKQK